MKRALMILGVGVIALHSRAAMAQSLSMRGVTLTPVEQGVADADPLSVSLRVLRPDYRLSTNFERVYEARLDPKVFGAHMGARADQTFFVRFAGGVAAVFPKSEYVQFRDGKLAAVPPGTVYSVGGPIERLLGAPSYDLMTRENSPRSAQAVDLSARMPATAAPVARDARAGSPVARQRREVHRSEPVARSIFEDEAYRCSRLDALVEQATRERR